MTIETLKSPNPRNRNSISVIKSKFLSVSSMNTLLTILKVTDARRDVILACGLYHRFPWRHLPPAASTKNTHVSSPPKPEQSLFKNFQRSQYLFNAVLNKPVNKLDSLACEQ